MFYVKMADGHSKQWMIKEYYDGLFNKMRIMKYYRVIIRLTIDSFSGHLKQKNRQPVTLIFATCIVLS